MEVGCNERMSFLRHGEIFRSDDLLYSRRSLHRGYVELYGGSGRELSPPAHRLDEFPVGYSWRVALQQSPLPLHQPELIVGKWSLEGKNYFASHRLPERCRAHTNWDPPGQQGGGSVKELSPKRLDPLAGFDPTMYGRF
jgi:hypothetical protein